MQIDTLKGFAQLKLPEVQTSVAESSAGDAEFERLLKISTKPKQEVVADVVGLLTSHSTLEGISLSGFSLESEIDKGGYLVVPAGIEVEGGYSGIVNYLAKVERLGRLVLIDNIELVSDEQRPSYVKAKIKSSLFVVRE